MQLRSQLKAYIPDATITEEQKYLTSLWKADDYSLIIDFGLDQEGVIPLALQQGFDVDPLIGIIGALSQCNGNDIGIVQALFLPVRNSWTESLVNSVTNHDGKSFFTDAPQLPRSVQEKIKTPLYGVVIRIGANSSSQQKANNLVRHLGGTLTQYNAPNGNSLIPLLNDDYPCEIHVQDVLDRQSHRSGMLLNRDELINFVHFPDSSVRSEKLLRQVESTKAAPALSQNNEMVLGENIHHGNIVDVTLSTQQRMRHMYVIGASGTGKSTLLLNMIIQDIQNGHGVALLDPHGDLVDQVLDFIPENRCDDVLLFNPSDEEYPIGFNIFSAHSETEKTLLASDLTGVFRRLSTSWGDQMNSVLANGILAMLESDQGGTLLTLRRFLIEKNFRKEFLKSVQDPEIVYYWEKEFPLLSGRPQAPVLTRLDTFLRPKMIRYMVAQKENKIDFGHVMNNKKIFLAKLSQGGIGEENSYLLGALIVAKIHQMALSRQSMEREKRNPFFLYIDEFQNFVTPSMESILSGARKYNLGLILAHQELRQLASKDRDVASSVISNPSTRVCFRMGDNDAVKLAGGFSSFAAQELQSLGIGQAICRIEQADYDFNLKTLPLPTTTNQNTESLKESIISKSRDKYATPKDLVEKLFENSPSKTNSNERKESVTEKSRAAKKTKPITSKEENPKTSSEPIAQQSHLPQKPTSPGRGGVQHKYLQQLIKRLGEERGYRAILEKSVLSGSGLVDISLEKNKEKIACEITVTTSPTHELANIQKCLAAGYDTVLALSHEKKQLNSIRKLARESLDDSANEKIHYFLPEEFINFLDDKQIQEKNTEKIVRGYKVKVNYKSVNATEQKQKRVAIAKLIVESMKRMKK